MKKLLSAVAITLTAFGISSCSENGFTVDGEITGAKDSILYFENMSLEGPVTIDSVKLNASGEFSFGDKRPEAPEFYRLRIGGQMINVAIDSNEVVNIKAQYATMPTKYEITGSEDNKRIKELSLMQITLFNKAMAVQHNQQLGADVIKDSLRNMIDKYKKMVTMKYIFKDPKAASSYFALFQTIGDYLIFDPRNNRNDIKVFAAVATSWDTFYPGALRGQNLHNIAIEGMKTERIVDAENSQKIDPSKVSTAGLIDIQLEDNKGVMRSLTQLKGKVVLLDFHVFASDDSPKRILMLRELYNKYQAQGFEIYQVSLDPDEHFWKQQTAALPWICVRDADGINSERLSIYNIQSLPEYFLIDKGNNLVGRSEQIKDRNASIKGLLK